MIHFTKKQAQFILDVIPVAARRKTTHLHEGAIRVTSTESGALVRYTTTTLDFSFVVPSATERPLSQPIAVKVQAIADAIKLCKSPETKITLLEDGAVLVAMSQGSVRVNGNARLNLVADFPGAIDGGATNACSATLREEDVEAIRRAEHATLEDVARTFVAYVVLDTTTGIFMATNGHRAFASRPVETMGPGSKQIAFGAHLRRALAAVATIHGLRDCQVYGRRYKTTHDGECSPVTRVTGCGFELVAANDAFAWPAMQYVISSAMVTNKSRAVFRVGRDMLRLLLENAKSMVDSISGVQLTFTPNELRIVTKTDDAESDVSMPIVCERPRVRELDSEEAIALGINPRYLLDAIANVADGEDVYLVIEDAISPVAVVTSTGAAMKNEPIAVVMVMRV